jgi:hypothetical protein
VCPPSAGFAPVAQELLYFAHPRAANGTVDWGAAGGECGALRASCAALRCAALRCAALNKHALPLIRKPQSGRLAGQRSVSLHRRALRPRVRRPPSLRPQALHSCSGSRRAICIHAWCPYEALQAPRVRGLG